MLQVVDSQYNFRIIYDVCMLPAGQENIGFWSIVNLYTFCILQKLKTFYLCFQRIVPLQLIDRWEDSRNTSTFKEVIMISNTSLCHMEAFIPIHYYIDEEGMTVH